MDFLGKPRPLALGDEAGFRMQREGQRGGAVSPGIRYSLVGDYDPSGIYPYYMLSLLRSNGWPAPYHCCENNV